MRSAPLPLPRNLPREVLAAAAQMDGLVSAAFPGGGTLLSAGRRCLVRILCGFFQVEISAVAPLGWLWRPPSLPPPNGRRAVPPLRSPAWSLWPGLDAARAPVRYFLDPRRRHPEAHFIAIRTAVGLPEPPWLPLEVKEANMAALSDRAEECGVGATAAPLVSLPPVPTPEVPPVASPEGSKKGPKKTGWDSLKYRSCTGLQEKRPPRCWVRRITTYSRQAPSAGWEGKADGRS